MTLFGVEFRLGERVSIPVGHNGDGEVVGKIVGRCLSIHGLVYLVRCDPSGEIVRMMRSELRHTS